MGTISDDTLKRAVTGNSDLSNASLAGRILISRLRREAASDPSSLPAKVNELRDFISKNAFAANDMASI